MLRIHILNVGHGDSIVLEFLSQNGVKSFAVIDSNCSGGGAQPKALRLLNSLGATHLSFVAITHPHADHYMGMRSILTAYTGKIDFLYTFPIRKDSNDLKNLVQTYKKFAVATDDNRLQNKLLELAHIFLLAGKAAGEWQDPSGTNSIITAPGFTDVKIFSLLPPSRVKGNFFQNIIDGKVEPERPQLNELSMAFLIEYAGQQIILGGDGTAANWQFQAKNWRINNITYSPIAVKIPHHGSKQDCSPRVLNTLFGDQCQKDAIACISANGKTHPSPDVLNDLVKRGIKPYCTNLAKRCGANRTNLITDPKTDPSLLKFLNSAAIDTDSSSQPCQGDIILKLAIGQPLQVETEFGNYCPLRGDLDFLGGKIH